MPEAIITPDAAKSLKEGFKQLRDEVELHVFTKPGVNEQFSQILVGLVTEIAKFDKRIKPEFHQVGDEASGRYGVERAPTLLVSPAKYKIRYTGAPLGEEGRSLILGIIMASTGRGIFDRPLAKRLEGVNESKNVKVFVSPTCPYCPQAALYAISAAVERPEFISAEIIEIYENPDLAEKYGAMSVPRIFVNEELTAHYLPPADEFVDSLAPGKETLFAKEAAAPEEKPAEETATFDIVIVGGGPAGLTAAIYAGRSGLKAVVLEKANVGGQVAITPIVENYPGFLSVGGKSLVDMMMSQASQYAKIKQGVGVKDIRKIDSRFEVITTGGVYGARAIVIATGATYRRLNVPGEEKLSGRGISYCATCDGYLFKDGKSVVVIGGGNTAVTDALYLDGLGAHVTLVSRTDTLKAEDRLKQGLFQRNLLIYWNTLVTEFIGERRLEKLKLKNLKDNSWREIKVDGAFIAVGYEPSNELAKMIGLSLSGEGYVKTDDRQRTSIPFVYAAGDLTGGEKQITVAVSQGTVAAMSAFEDLTKA